MTALDILINKMTAIDIVRYKNLLIAEAQTTKHDNHGCDAGELVFLLCQTKQKLEFHTGENEGFSI